MNHNFTANSSVLYVIADCLCDYVPVVSTFVNLHDLFHKYAKRSDPGIEASMDLYTVHIQKKSTLRCITLLVPVIGNLSIFVFDLIVFVYMYTVDTSVEAPSHIREDGAGHFKEARLFNGAISNDNSDTSLETMYREINHSIDSKKTIEDSNVCSYKLVLKEVSKIRQCFEELTIKLKKDRSFKFYRQGFCWNEQDHCGFDPNKQESLPVRSSDYIKNTIEKIMRFQDCLYSPDYNGYKLLERNSYIRFIRLSTVAGSPIFFTGILGLEAGSISQPQIPSLELVNILAEITDQIVIATDIENLQESQFSLKHRPLFIQTKQKVVALCRQMKQHYERLMPLLGFFSENLVKLSEIHWGFFQKIQQNEEMHNLCSLNRDHYAPFNEFDWDELKKNLVAERKFFFKHIYSNQGCSEALHSNVLPVAKACERSSWIFAECMVASFAAGAAGYLMMGPYGSSAAVLPMMAVQLEVDNLKMNWSRRLRKVQNLRQLIERSPLKRSYVKGIGQYFVHRSSLILNMRERKVEWIENPLASQIILADVEILPGAPEKSLFVNPHSLFKKAVVNRIQRQASPNPNYRNLVIQLLDAYHECLEKKIENQSIDSSHLLYPLKDGIVVYGEKRGSIPLILPKKLMHGLEKEFSSLQRDLMHTGQAGVVPFYTFSTDEGKLRIVFKTSDRVVIGTALIAEFDPMTVRSFQPDLSSLSQLFDPSEFLLQALYGAMINKSLGLPDCGSFAILERNDRGRELLVPQESEFLGCYHLWETRPGRVISYNSEIYDGTQSSFEKIKPKELQVVPTAHYRELVTELYNIKHYQIGEKLEYDRLFLILQGLTTLLSSVDWKDVREIFKEGWGLPHPDKLYDFEQPRAALFPNVDLVEAKTLQDYLLVNPSEIIRALQEKIEKFDRIIEISDRA